MTALVVLLAGMIVGGWLRGALPNNVGISATTATNGNSLLTHLKSVIGLSQDYEESPRLAKVPLRLRLDKGVENLGIPRKK